MDLTDAYIRERHVRPAFEKEWAKRDSTAAEDATQGIVREPLPSVLVPMPALAG